MELVQCLVNPRSFRANLKEESKSVVIQIADNGLKRQKLASPSTTRWVEQISTLDGFVEAFEAIFFTLEYMKTNEKGDFNSSTSDVLFLHQISCIISCS